MNASLAATSRAGLVVTAVIATAVFVGACSSPATSQRTSSAPSASADLTTPPLQGDNLEPGTYAIAVGTLKASITVPAGWSTIDGRGVAKGSDEALMAVVFWPFPTDFTDGLYTDPCHWKTTAIDPPVGPTVDDLANALAAQEMRGDPVPTDVTIGGYSGKLVAMSVPTDLAFADCDDGYFYSWAGRYHQGPGQVDDVYILDVEGERQVLIAHRMPGVSAAAKAEQQTIVDSIVLTP